MRGEPSRKELTVALVAALSWLAVVLIALVCSAAAYGQSTGSAVCRVHNRLGGFANVGSGTLVDKTEDGREGLILTCWHLFREGTGQVVVQFNDGRSHGARVVALDRDADLAALAIANPRAEPVGVNLTVARHAKLTACGFGHTGQYRCAVGINGGESRAPGQTSLLVNNGVRSGDSGGGVFDEQGQLVAVVWGERDGVTYASCGTPLRDFLGRVLGRRTQLVVNCPNGLCARPSPPQPAGPRAPSHGSDGRGPDSALPGPGTDRLAPQAVLPQDPGTGEHSILDDPRFDELAAAIDRLRTEKLDRGDLQRFESESTIRHESLLERIRVMATGGGPSVGKAAGAAAVSLLGLGGPLGWLVLVGGTVGGGIIGWALRRRVRGRRGDPFPNGGPDAVSNTLRDDVAETLGAAGSAATFQPTPRDDHETRQLLQLSRLEGRDPLQDATVGRLALDRLDEIADSERSDPDHKTWADRLRRELRERFNEIAPTNFTPNPGG
ncbi:MAG: trypsin-like peptidase domain-containing protein [Planctomycetes bacterium]|nr:trypsin-like peptidase domain-containing protein [Planctomycetota bacterium]